MNKGFDAALFAENMRESLDGKTVGWSFAISQNGKIVQYDAGGYARLSTNSPEVKYTYTTRQAIGSCSKTISALALRSAAYIRDNFAELARTTKAAELK